MSDPVFVTVVRPLLITAALPVDETLRNTAVVSLMAFYSFLVKHRHLTSEMARPVFDQLRPLWLCACSWALAQLSSSPDDLRRGPAHAVLN